MTYNISVTRWDRRLVPMDHL